MPAKTAKSRSRSARSKSTDKKTTKSRSVSRSRGRPKAPKAASETKRPRSRSRETSPNSPTKTTSTRTVSSRSSTRTTTKVETSTKTPERSTKSPICNLCCKIPCIATHPIGKYLCTVAGLLAPFFFFYLNCLVFTSGSSSNWGPSMLIWKVNVPIDWHRYFDFKVLGFLWTNAFLISIVTKYIKLGKKMSQVAGGKRYEYCNDAWFMFTLFQLPLVALHLKGVCKVTTGIIQGIPAIWTTMFTFLLFDSILVFLQSNKMVRSSSNKGFGQGLLDFYHGKDTRPVVYGFDVKVLAFRTGLFTLFSIIAAMVVDQYETRGHVSPGLGFIFASFSVRLLDYIVFEHKRIPFFHFSQETCGYHYLMKSYIDAPFLWSLLASFSYVHFEVGTTPKLPCDFIHMGIAATVFLIGYYISRASENQRYAFRTDPHHPRFASMEKIPTTSGRRLLAGGWWGLVRFPNYLGGLLMTFSWAIPAGRAYPHVWLIPLIALVQALCIIHRVEQHMLSKHGAAFAKYKTAVPKRLIPGVL